VNGVISSSAVCGLSGLDASGVVFYLVAKLLPHIVFSFFDGNHEVKLRLLSCLFFKFACDRELISGDHQYTDFRWFFDCRDFVWHESIMKDVRDEAQSSAPKLNFVLNVLLLRLDSSFL